MGFTTCRYDQAKQGAAMTRTTVPLTVDQLDRIAELRAPCRSCLFWELDPVLRGRLDEEDRTCEKDAWVSEVLREWGSCGRVLLVDGRAEGYATYAPAAFVPGALQLPTAPISPDAVLLTTVWVAPEMRGGGLARMLVQGVARDLVGRGCPAVEAFGDTRVLRGAALQPCVFPADFLGRVGFFTQRAHVTTPRMRMELRSALTWKDEVEQALEKLWGVVRPAPARPTRAPQPRGAAGTPGAR